MKISDLPIKNVIATNDSLIVDNNGTSTQRIKVTDLAFAQFAYLPQTRNQIIRGKSLGSAFTEWHKTQIQTGTFNDMFLGDYWEYGGVKWRIVDFNYYNSSANGVKNHVIILPDQNLSRTAATSAENSTKNYCDSLMYNAAAALKSRFATLFGDSYIMGHFDSFANDYDGSSTYPYYSDEALSRGGIFTTLPDEIMLFGAHIMASNQAGRNANIHITGRQFAYFKAGAPMPTPTEDFWLRDKSWYNYFVCWRSYRLSQDIWNNQHGLRPFAAITGEPN